MIRTNSILLNSPTQSPRLTPQHLPSYSDSNASSCSSSEMHVQIHRSASTPRRIRFAPLPDQNPIDIEQLPQTESPIPSTITTDPIHKPKSSFFRQIFKRSSLVIDAPPRRFSTEDITSRILRRPRTPQAQQQFGSPLSRTPSTTQPKRPSTAPSSSKPRSSINSLGSGGGRHTMPPNRTTPPTSPTSTTSRPSVPTKSGMRMLNGRVYGSKRQPPADPFANVRDEPEFVEWGYGGMGSVTHSSDSKYSALAKGAPALLSHGQAQKIPVGGGRGGAAVAVERKGDDDDDDGSGMGWVRKRKLERERLAREKEAAEVTTVLDTYSRRTSTDGSSAVDSTSTDLSTLAASSAPTTPPSTSDTLPQDQEEQEQHILQAVRLSPTHHHHKRPSTSGDLVVGTTHSPVEPAKSSPSTTSESSSDDDETPREDDDESEVEETEDQRKTSLGAGVEKISRHKEGLH